jgi:hypothetical protein
MIAPINFEQKNIVGFTMTGNVTDDEIKQWASALDRKSDGPDKLRVYIEAEKLDDVTLDAILADLKFDVTHLTDFEKAAFVSDTALSKLSSFMAGLIPGLETKQFSLDEKEQAKQWIQH